MLLRVKLQELYASHDGVCFGANKGQGILSKEGPELDESGTGGIRNLEQVFLSKGN